MNKIILGGHYAVINGKETYIEYSKGLTNEDVEKLRKIHNKKDKERFANECKEKYTLEKKLEPIKELNWNQWCTYQVMIGKAMEKAAHSKNNYTTKEIYEKELQEAELYKLQCEKENIKNYLKNNDQ